MKHMSAAWRALNAKYVFFQGKAAVGITVPITALQDLLHPFGLHCRKALQLTAVCVWMISVSSYLFSTVPFPKKLGISAISSQAAIPYEVDEHVTLQTEI